MSKFNLNQYIAKHQKLAIELPNGITTVTIPTGNDMGQGVDLTNESGQPVDDNAGGKRPLRDIIGDILYESTEGQSDDQKIQGLAKQALNAEIPPEFAGNDDLAQTVMALGHRASENPDITSVNTDTGENEQSLEGLAGSIAQMAGEGWDPETLIKEARERESASPIPEQNQEIPTVMTAAKKTPVKNTESEEFNEVQKEDPVKKRKKGNPFKVLMGLVGKMLDHGMGRREIVRKVMRQEKNKWKPETIEKSIGVVKNMRKKEQKKKSEGIEASVDFNLNKYAQSKDNKKDKKPVEFKGRKSIYDIDRDIRLMSTMELISRFAYLEGAKSFDEGLYNENNPGNKQQDNTKLNKDFKMVKEELGKRNYSNEYLDVLTKTVKGQAPEK